MLAALALSSPARADKPLIAVVPFTGPRAKQAEAVVVRALRRKAQLVPPSKWAASARKLFAHTHKPDDISSVAMDVGARVVITGVVKREGRTWTLAVSVRDGKTGASKDKLKYPLKGPRLTPKTLSLLAQEVEQAFEHTLSSAGAAPKLGPCPEGRVGCIEAIDETPPPPATTPPPPVKIKKGAKPAAPVAQGEEDELPPGLGGPTKKEPSVATAPTPPPPTIVAAPTPPRPRWAPYFDVTAGGSITGRSFDFVPTTLPHFSSGKVGGLHFDLTLYPLASLWKLAGGVLSGIGLGATIDKPFWPPSSATQMGVPMKFATSELRVEGGLRWRFVIYKPIPRPELLLVVGGGLHQFGIAKTMDMNGNLTDVGPPDVSYSYATIGGILRLHFAEWARLWAGFSYQQVVDPGSVAGADEYGPLNAFSLRVHGGLAFFVWRGLKLEGSGFYERFSLGFTGMGARGPASSAVDQYFGGVLAVGYEL